MNPPKWLIFIAMAFLVAGFAAVVVFLFRHPLWAVIAVTLVLAPGQRGGRPFDFAEHALRYSCDPFAVWMRHRVIPLAIVVGWGASVVALFQHGFARMVTMLAIVFACDVVVGWAIQQHRQSRASFRPAPGRSAPIVIDVEVGEPIDKPVAAEGPADTGGLPRSEHPSPDQRAG
jgi:hypothetical protein